jgi:hypothetical protein
MATIYSFMCTMTKLKQPDKYTVTIHAFHFQNNHNLEESIGEHSGNEGICKMQ